MATKADAQSGTSTTAEPQPRQLGKYVIQRRLGAGGMGTVYLALDSSLNRTVALKILSRERAANTQLVKRFTSEGQSAARLEHDNIVKVFESGEIDGHLYLALEFVEGVNVEELVRKRGTLPVRRTIEIVKQVAAALQHAYERSIVHRDIKPSNLLIRNDGMVKLADMGLARVIDETLETSITRDGMTVGTVDFMAPEQATDSKKADIRSDLYSLGCTWYQMLTGKAPFPEGSVTEKLTRHHSSPPPDPRRINERIPDGVVAVIHKLMAKKPNDRYQTPNELLEDLKQTHLGRMGVDAHALASLASSETSHAAHEPDDEPGRAPPAETSSRSARTESPDVPQKGRYKPLKDKRPTPPRNAVRTAGNGKAAPKEKRELPPRSENPEALGVSQRKLDPELLKFAFFGLLALGVIAAVGYGMYSLSGFGDDDRQAGANPYLTQQQSGDSTSNTVATPTADPYGQQGKPPTPVEAEPTPNAELTDFQNRSPFPGAEDAQQNPAWDVPAWVYDERAAAADGLKTFIVSGRSGSAGEYATLGDALKAMPRQGGIVEFADRGPFHVSPQSFDDGRHLVLRAAAGQQPVLLIEEPLPAGTSAWLTLRGGHLRISGVHLVVSGRALAPGSSCIALTAATAYLHDCTVTLADPAAGAVSVVQLTGGTQATRCVFENVLTRGNNLVALSTTGHGIEAVVGNCLFASGDAPVVAIGTPAQAESRSDAEPPPATALHWLASAAVSRNSVFALTHRAGLAPPSVLLKTRRVAFAADAAAPSTGFRFDAWPQNAPEDLENPRAQGVRWESDQTYWIGWPTRVRMSPLAGVAVGDVIEDAGWRQFWRAPADSRSFIDPPAVALDVDHSRLTPTAAAWLAAALPGDAPPVTFAPAALPEAPHSLIERLLARSERPRLPATFGVPPGGREVRIDLEKDGLKLNRILNGPECPNGARVILTGSGRDLIEPVVVRDKSLRIEFESSDPLFVVEPVARTTDERPEALIRVERGHIDLIGGQLRIPSSSTRSYPRRVLQVVDGSFSVRNCSLQAALRDGAQDFPAVEWTRSADGPAGERQFALIENSFIAGRFQGVGGNLADRSLEIQNCVFFTLGRGLQFDVGDGDSHGFLLVSRSTLSVSRALFQLSAPQDARLHVFTHNCVFGPAVDADPKGPAVLVHGSATDPAQGIVWWDERSAYERQFTRFRIAETNQDAPAQDFKADWERAWGPDHIVEPLTGQTSVVLADPLPTPDKTTALNFEMKASSGAAQAGAGGAPIGANPSTIGPQGQAPPATSNTPAPTPNRPRNQPDF